MRKNQITDKKNLFKILLNTSFICFLSSIIAVTHANGTTSPSEGVDMFVEESSWEKYSGTLPSYKYNKNEDINYTEASFSIYYGDLFRIIYPKSFSLRPLNPVIRHNINQPLHRPIKLFDGDNEYENIASKTAPELPPKYFEYVDTDEAYFTSPDGLVEFFVYAKDSANEKPDYVKVTKDEVQLSVKSTKFSEEEEHLNYILKVWVTIKAKNNSYYRSYIHQRACHSDARSSFNDCETQVLGVKYLEVDDYNEYRYSFIAFSRSLERSASH